MVSDIKMSSGSIRISHNINLKILTYNEYLIDLQIVENVSMSFRHAKNQFFGAEFRVFLCLETF